MGRSSTLRRLAGDCGADGYCPAVDLVDDDKLVLTGPVVSYAELRCGPHEQTVELPIDLVREALRALDAR